jgi:hypothetical protein
MKLVIKLDEDGKAVIVDGKIVYIDEDSTDKKEYPLDPPSMYSKIAELGKENKTHRTKATEIEAKYLSLAEIEDIEAWKKEADAALETVKSYSEKDFMEAGKVEKLKADIKEAYESQLSAKDEKAKVVAKANADALAGKDGQIRSLMVSNRFSTSPHFTGDNSITTMPPDVAEAFFGSNFKVEDIDGKLELRAYQGKDEITSQLNPGEPAGFEEAIGIIVDKYPNKDHILRAPGGGSGGGGGQGGDGSPSDKLTKLNEQLKKATEDQNTQQMVALKNQIHKLKQAG